MTHVEYKPIEPTLFHAARIQHLTYYDALIGGYSEPVPIPPSRNLRHVSRQRADLRDNPDNYLGAFVGGKFSGYLKIADWRIVDEQPFATDGKHLQLETLQELGETLTPEAKLGIFGLALSTKLDTELAEEVIVRLFDDATLIAQATGKVALNMSLYEFDDVVPPIALEHGFEFTGRVSLTDEQPRRVTKAVRRLYSKPLDS